MLKDESIYVKEERVERRLRKISESFKTLFNQVPDPIAIVDKKGKILAVNDRVVEKTGFQREELVDKNFLRTKIATMKSKAIMLKKLVKRMTGAKLKPYDIEGLTKDGKKLQFELNATKIGYEGKPADLVIFRDITERKRLEELKNQFMSAVTHELRTPLASIKAYLDIIASEEPGSISKNVESSLVVVKRNADRLSSLTDDLLDIRRLESGKFQLNLKQMDFREVIDQCVQESRPLIKDGFSIEVPEHSLMVEGDPIRLIQVVMNLLVNAIKYTPEGDKVNLNVEEKQDLILVQVKDTGIGIRKEDLDRVFQPFTNIEKPTYYKGAGLGLSLTKGLVEAHGGEIWAESAGEGKGATFTFTLPIRKSRGVSFGA